MKLQKLDLLLREAKINANPTQLQNLITHIDFLLKWNQTFNLTSITDIDQIITKHIVDSAIVGHYIKGKTFIDVGTGAGFPGLVLAILNPNKNFTLVDSIGKKINFVNYVIQQLRITNARAMHLRVQDLEAGFDGLITRAVGKIPELINWCEHLVKPEGHFYFMTGEKPEVDQKMVNLPYTRESIEIKVPGLIATRNLLIMKRITEEKE